MIPQNNAYQRELHADSKMGTTRQVAPALDDSAHKIITNYKKYNKKYYKNAKKEKIIILTIVYWNNDGLKKRSILTRHENYAC